MNNSLTSSIMEVDFLKHVTPLLDSGAFELARPNHYHLAAVSTLNFALQNQDFKNILNSGVVICDSRPIFLTFKSLRSPVEMMRGSDFIRAILKSDLGSKRHFFIGSSSRQLQLLSKYIAVNYPHLQVSGTYSPPVASHEEIAELVLNNTDLHHSDIVWIGLGSPKQDFVAAVISNKLNITTVGIGAALDYISGAAREAPKLFQASGLEWLYRLVIEPKRLWRRYLFGNSKFLVLACKALLQSFR